MNISRALKRVTETLALAVLIGCGGGDGEGEGVPPSSSPASQPSLSAPQPPSVAGGSSEAQAAATGFPADLRITALAIDPGTPGTLYAGTGAGAFRSTDGGASWTKTGLAGPVASLVIDPATTTTLYAHSSDDVYKSTDQGARWRLLPRPIGDVKCVFYCGGVSTLAITGLTSPPTLYAGTGPFTIEDEQLWHYSGWVFKSTDGGESWRLIGLPWAYEFDGHSVSALAIASIANQITIYAGTSANFRFGESLFKSTDGGVSWTVTDLVRAVRFLEIDPAISTTVYAGASYEAMQGVFKSINGGTSWQFLSGLGNGVGALAIDRVSTTTLYAGTPAGLLKSTDAGATWNPTPMSSPVFAIAIDPLNPRTLYAGTESGVYKSTDGAASWSPTTLATGACSGHGTPQQNGMCVCDSGYRGPNCAVLATAHADFDGDERSDVLWSRKSGSDPISLTAMI